MSGFHEGCDYALTKTMAERDAARADAAHWKERWEFMATLHDEAAANFLSAFADAERLAAAWADLLAFYPTAYGLDELTEYLRRGGAALAAHEELTR